MQYGFRDSPITIAVNGVADEVLLSVHNDGAPIPPEKIGIIFKSLTRVVEKEGSDPESTNLGLGLFITEDIVVSHGGTIQVTSSEEDGTTFTARFPRHDTEAEVPAAGTQGESPAGC